MPAEGGDGMRHLAGIVCLGILAASLLAGPAFAHPEGSHEPPAVMEKPPEAEARPVILQAPDVELLDQDGGKVKFRSDVLGDRIVVLDVFFTSCGLVCPILSAIMADLQDALGERLGKEVSLVSVTVDPVTDIPPRLKEYSERFHARPGWTFLTGKTDSIAPVLKSLGAYTADFTRHPSMILVGDARTGEWTRYYGLPPADLLLGKVNELAAARRKPLRQSEEEQRSYFTDLPLVDQDGREVRFYTDVLKDRTVVVSFIYTSCMDVCPLLMANLTKVKTLLGDKMGRKVHFVSISVDPVDDTPEELKKYAERWEAGPGWTFLTGRKDRIDWVIYKLGQYSPDFQEHSVLLLLGDVKTGRWMKVPGDQPPEAIAGRIDTLLGKGEKSE
jgi:cytochrome oxidase Cu insertion factor (SCO1/SenC/PrrC family)